MQIGNSTPCSQQRSEETVQTDFIIGRESLRPRVANTQSQNDETIANQIAENNDLEVVTEDPKQGVVEKEVRKFTRKEALWARANEKLPLIRMQCNKYQQPTGPYAKEFPTVVTTFIRTKQFPVKYTDWRDVPVEHKEKLIDDLSAIYVMDECLKMHTLQTDAKKWRSFKADMKTKAFKTDDPLQIFTKDELLSRHDKRIDPEQWKILVEYWLSEKGQQSSKHGKQSRSMVAAPHTNGSSSFARPGYEWVKEHGYEPSRYELFMKTHTKADGVPLDKALPKITELTNKAKDHPELLEVPIEKGDMFSHVFGRDPRGYVRGVGLGPTPASLGIDGHRKCTSTRVQMANRHSEKTEEQNKLLINCLGVLFDEVRDLREKVDGGQGRQVDDDVVERVSSHTPEHGSNPTPTMIMPLRGRALL